MPLTLPSVVSIIVAILPIFIGNNATEQEIAAFLVAVAPFLGQNAPKSGTIPAFRIAGESFGPIPFGPVT